MRKLPWTDDFLCNSNERFNSSTLRSKLFNSQVQNKAGYSVLMYAAKKDAVEYVQHLLKAVQPEQQFDQLRNMECPVLYDVSYLTPQSWNWMTKRGVKFLTCKSAPSSKA
jgi:ankyrin repeat protein